jgi:hypothetical protein
MSKSYTSSASFERGQRKLEKRIRSKEYKSMLDEPENYSKKKINLLKKKIINGHTKKIQVKGNKEF